MGNYTEFVFGAELKKDTPKEVIETLTWMIKGEDTYTPPDHPLFSTTRWESIGTGCSYSFGYVDPLSDIHVDDISGRHIFAIRCSIKNYEDEIELFIDWIRPYIKRGSGENDFLGYSIYEEAKKPTLYYLHEESP